MYYLIIELATNYNQFDENLRLMKLKLKGERKMQRHTKRCSFYEPVARALVITQLI